MTATEQETEQEPPIPGGFPEMAREVRRLMGWYDAAGNYMPQNKKATRVAYRNTGITHATVANMLQGDRPSRGKLIEFAEGMKGDINRLLLAAKYKPLKLPPSTNDILALVGTDVSIQQGLGIPLTQTRALDGTALFPSASPEEGATLEEVLPPVEEVRAIRVNGSCMEPFFHDGDVLLVCPPPQEIQDGQKVIVFLPETRDVACRIYQRDEAHSYIIGGVVVKSIRDE